MAIGRIPEPLAGIQESIIAAKGDLIVGTANDQAGILSVGTNGHTLVADSATATGLKWAAPATSTFRGCLAAGNTLLVANNTITIVPFASTEVYDTDGYHSTTTNTGRITIPTGLGGYYLLWYSGTWEDSQAGDRIIYLYKNGSQINQVYQYVRDVPGGYFSQQFSTVVSTVAGDYFEVRVNQGSGGNKNLYGDSGAGNLPGLRFGCALLGV